MALALYRTAPGKTRPGIVTPFRADMFVFVVTCLNDAVAIALLALANIKARAAVAAFDQLVQCEAVTGTLSGRGGARRGALPLTAVLLCLAAYVLAVAVAVSLDDTIDQYDDDPDRASDLLGLVHMPSLPLQLFSCMMCGNHVFLLWLQVRTLNLRLRSTFLGARSGPRASRGPFIRMDPNPNPNWNPVGHSSLWATPATPRRPCAAGAALRVDGLLSAAGAILGPPACRGVADMVALRSLYSQLRQALTLLSAAHGLELLLLLLVTFAATTTSMYIVVTSHEGSSALALAWSALIALMLFAVLAAGELVKRESRRTADLTQRILIQRDLSPVLRQEVRGFSQQLLHQGLEVSVYGFLPLDFSMLQGMVGSVTTYLIMVIQLSPEEGEQEATNATTTATAAS